jgi:hypothetical protein
MYGCDKHKRHIKYGEGSMIWKHSQYSDVAKANHILSYPDSDKIVPNPGL